MNRRWSADSSTKRRRCDSRPASRGQRRQARVVEPHRDLGSEVLEQVAGQAELREDEQVDSARGIGDRWRDASPGCAASVHRGASWARPDAQRRHGRCSIALNPGSALKLMAAIRGTARVKWPVNQMVTSPLTVLAFRGLSDGRPWHHARAPSSGDRTGLAGVTAAKAGNRRGGEPYGPSTKMVDLINRDHGRGARRRQPVPAADRSDADHGAGTTGTGQCRHQRAPSTRRPAHRQPAEHRSARLAARRRCAQRVGRGTRGEPVGCRHRARRIPDGRHTSPAIPSAITDCVPELRRPDRLRRRHVERPALHGQLQVASRRRTTTTVVFTFCNPDVAFLSKIAFSVFAHQRQRLADHSTPPTGDLISTHERHRAVQARPAGSSGTEIDYSRFDDYWGEKAATPKAVLQWQQGIGSSSERRSRPARSTA